MYTPSIESSSSSSVQPSTPEKMVVPAKIAVVTLFSLVILAGACVVGARAFALLAQTSKIFSGEIDQATAKSLVAGTALLGSAIGLIGSAVATPFFGMSEGGSKMDSPMYQRTNHNVRDVALYALKGTGISSCAAVGAGVVAPVLLPFAVLGGAAFALVGGFFFMMLNQGVGH